ncbi:hypothetical protein KAK07_07235 [Ideonella sp. 4Y16]|uniref:hypothetical protein n=1 Tax=Ideonella alba TaxID=2824118 RepID=UPI001B388189|nr:hypothetical protein [Ideonella alba]MBQ0943125.1 hypothetical protein [Ideonella alba]
MNKSGVFVHWAYNAASALVPILMIPHLLKTLGPNEYGDLALIQIISFTTLIVVDCGLSTVGPKILAEARKSDGDCALPRRLLLLHFLMWVVASLLGFVWLTAVSSERFHLYGLSQLAVLAAFLPPAYLIIHRGGQLTYGLLGIASRGIHLFTVLLFVRVESDAWIYFLSNAAISLCSSLFLYRRYCFSNDAICRSSGSTRNGLIDLWRMGLAQLSRRAASVPITVVIPSLLAGHDDKALIALYSLIDKIRTVVWQIINPVLAAFAAYHFSVEESARLASVYRVKRRFVFIILSIVASTVLLPSFLATQQILELANYPLSDTAIWCWRLGSIGAVPAIILAYAMSILSPDVVRGRRLTLAIWCCTAAVGLLSVPLMDVLGLHYAVLAMAIWETLVVAMLFLHLPAATLTAK